MKRSADDKIVQLVAIKVDAGQRVAEISVKLFSVQYADSHQVISFEQNHLI